MPKQSTHIQNNFTAGELSPLADARVDLGKYFNGCRTLQNFMVYPFGGAFRRPGTKYVATVPDNDNFTRLIPFQYSDTDAYILEFSDYLIRFYRTVSGVSGLILDDNLTTVSSIVSPYSSVDLPLLQYVQSGDVMYITHPDYKPRRLVRYDHNTWTISAPDFVRGPFLPENDTNTTIKIREYAITAVSAGAGGTFTIANEGDLTDFIVPGSTISIHGSEIAANNGNWTVDTVDYGTPPDFVITVDPSETVTADATPDGKIWPDLTTGMVKLMASGPLFEPTHVGALWEISLVSGSASVTGSFTGFNTGVSATIAVAYEQKLLFVTHGTWTGTISLEVSYDNGGAWVTYAGPYAFVADGNAEIREDNTVDDALYRVNMSAHTSGTIKYNLVNETYMQKGVVEISSILNSTNASAIVKTALSIAGSETRLWAEGAWSDKRGWPVSVAFYEQRLFFGGNAYQPITIWGSKSLPGGDYHNFAAGVNDDDAIVFTLAESAQDPIKWMSSDKQLIIGAAGGEYTLGASSSTEPITPTNVSHPQQQGIRGSANIMPIRTPIGHLFIEAGGLKVNELVYSWEQDRFVVVDMTRLSEHITEGGITEVALQKRPETILWCITDDGVLVGLTYLREEEIVCWHRHVTDGYFESVARIPGDTEDEIWLVVRRTIGGATKRYVEKMMPWNWGDDQEDAFFVDCALTYDSTPTTIISSNLSHLEGKTVAILADGSNHADKAVSGGAITLDRSASVVHIGLPYTSTLKPMKLAKGSMLFGSPKRISHITLNFYKTGYAQFGSQATDMAEVIFSQADDSMDGPTPLFTGVKVLNFPGGFDSEGTVIIQSAQPMPLTVLSANYLIEES